MIIVSQDKEKIINFDNVTEIVVSKNEICITDDIYKEFGETIGTYTTEERAKDVLQEIIEIFTNEEFESLLNDGEIKIK